jgi:hypothetical protein
MRFPIRLAAACTAVALFSLPAAVAHAQGHSSPSLSDRETARNLMDEGDKKRDSGDLKAALVAYEKADALMKVPTTGIEVARTQIALGKLLEARETLNRVSKIPAKAGEPAPFREARKQVDALNADLANRIPSVVVVPANTDPAQPPTINIDGEDIPSTVASVPRKINPGTHVAIVKSGKLEKKVEFIVAERENKTVDVDFKDQVPPPPPPPPPPPTTTKPQPTGTSTGKILMFGGFGLAAVGIGVGAVTGLMSISKTGDIKDHCKDDKCTKDQADAIDSAKLLGNVSTIAFIAGGVGAGVGVVGLLMVSKESKENPAENPGSSGFRPTNIRAVLGPSYAGLAGAF